MIATLQISDAHVENVCQVSLPRLYACVRCEWRKKRPCDAKKLSRKSRRQRKKKKKMGQPDVVLEGYLLMKSTTTSSIPPMKPPAPAGERK